MGGKLSVAYLLPVESQLVEAKTTDKDGSLTHGIMQPHITTEVDAAVCQRVNSSPRLPDGRLLQLSPREVTPLR